MTGYTLLCAMGEIDENLVLDAQEVFMKENKKHLRPVRIAVIAAAAALLLTGTILAARYYTRAADKAESHWNAIAETEMSAAQKDYVDDRSADIGESVTDAGITITLDSVTCAEDRVYLTIQKEIAPELIVGDAYTSTMVYDAVVVNEEYGTLRYSNAESSDDGSGEDMELLAVTFADLPEGASLCDGKTTMELHFTAAWIYCDTEGKTEETTAKGTWDFEFLLPENESGAPIAAEEDVRFAGELALTLEDITITETGVKFSVLAPCNDYGVVEKDMLPLAKAAEPDSVFYSVEAFLADGTKVPSTSASMSLDEESGLDQWRVDWITPVAPDSIVSLVFSDGETETIIDIE